jgi:hypothetical protein
MKNIILAFSLIALAACSSAPKDDTPVEEASESVEAPTPVPEAETQQEASNTKSMSADTGEDMEGGFPDVEGTERSGATCKNGDDERMVSVIDTREGPCGVVYTKHSRKKTVAYAKNDMGFCDKVYDNIVGNLTNGGFDCGGAQPTAKPEESSEDGGSEE